MSNKIEADTFPKDIAESIKLLWADAGVQECYSLPKTSQLISAKQFFFFFFFFFWLFNL